MRGASQAGYPKGCHAFKFLALMLALCLLLATPSFGQNRFGQTHGGGYPLPSVSSMGGYPLPSVSSIPNTGFRNQFHNGTSFNHSGRYRRGGYGYALPYYIPFGDYGYDYVGGPDMYSGQPDLYSGPPLGPNGSTLHIIVEQPPAQSYRPPVDDAQMTAAQPPPTVQEQPASARDAKPREPTVLVFRDGHKQEVSNYAIMEQTVYVFDDGTHKIPLANLDVPATVKANDDRGMEFKLPAVHPAQKKNSDLQPNGTPDHSLSPTANVASVQQ